MGVSLQDAKEWLGLDEEDTLDDHRLTLILQGVKAQVDAFCGTPLVASSGVQKFDGGALVWYLDRRPVVEITSILDPAGNSITDDDYLLHEELGILESNSSFPRAVDAQNRRARWAVTYKAGHFATDGAVPGDVALAILDLVADYYHKAGPDVQSQKVGIENTLAFIPNPNTRFILPPRVQQALGPYRKIGV